MFKHSIVKVVIGLALSLFLLGGAVLGPSMPEAHTAPVHHLLACAPPFPPCI